MPCLYDGIMSLYIIQQTEDIILRKSGAHMLGGRLFFDKERNGNYVQATQVVLAALLAWWPP